MNCYMSIAWARVGCISQKLLLVLRATKLEVDGEGVNELHLVLQASPHSVS